MTQILASSTHGNSAEFDFEAWRRQWQDRRCAMRIRLASALEDGRPVIETLGVLTKSWQRGNGPFIEPANSSPAYLADHLESRHFGFGTILVIDGQTYRLGLEATGRPHHADLLRSHAHD